MAPSATARGIVRGGSGSRHVGLAGWERNMGRALVVIAVAGASALMLLSGPSASAAPKPIARYTFDSTAADSSGGHNGNLINGATIVTNGAKVGAGALQLDGVDDYVGLVPNDGVTDFGAMQNGYTIAAWVNPARLTGVQRVFGNDRSTGASGYGFGLN